jgi:hypothetical protein
VVGVPHGGAHAARAGGADRFFVNALPLRAECAATLHAELLARTREAVLAGYAHQDVPVREAGGGAARGAQPRPLAPLQVMFTLMDAPLAVPELPGLAMRAMEGGPGPPSST